MVEALLDPKTWLFALFAALDNIPNSLLNQRQIIVNSFGFTPLQTTLLGCVDGIIEIVTIWSGVKIAASLKDSRAYVGVLYFIPNLLGVLLVNFLPWENKIGLLFSVWMTGEYFACQFVGELFLTKPVHFIHTSHPLIPLAPRSSSLVLNFPFGQASEQPDSSYHSRGFPVSPQVIQNASLLMPLCYRHIV